ncbi:MAG: hypothetical protein LC721_09985 [Actinobacteria bacterium]|nr:hypothetical protein [Actinomycetota bacterium]
MSEETRLNSWYLHEKLVLSLLSMREAIDLTRRIPGPEHPFARALRTELFERALSRYLAHDDIGSLVVEHLRGRLKQGQLVWLEQAIAFRGVGVALEVIERGGNGRASFSTRLATDKGIRASGTYSAARLTCDTAADQLSGAKRQFVLGYVQAIIAGEIELRPIVIARRWLRPTPDVGYWYPVDPAHVWPCDVDQFAGVDFGLRLTKADLNVLKDISETVGLRLHRRCTPSGTPIWTTRRYLVTGPSPALLPSSPRSWTEGPRRSGARAVGHLAR